MVKNIIYGLIKQNGRKNILSLLASKLSGGVMSDDEFIERRNSTRLRFSNPVDISSKGDSRREVISNLSPRGLRIKASQDLNIKGRYNFKFSLPGGPRVEFVGQVRWKKLKGRSVYYGVQFDQDIFSNLRMRLYFIKLMSERKKQIEEE